MFWWNCIALCACQSLLSGSGSTVSCAAVCSPWGSWWGVPSVMPGWHLMHGTYLLPCQPAAHSNSSAGRAGFYHRAFTCISMWYRRNINVYVLEYEQQKAIFGYSSLQLLFCCIWTKHYKSWDLSYVKLLDFGFWVIANIAEVKFGAMHHWWCCHLKI